MSRFTTFDGINRADGTFFVSYENLCQSCRDVRDRWIHGRGRNSTKPPDACEDCVARAKARIFHQSLERREAR